MAGWAEVMGGLRLYTGQLANLGVYFLSKVGFSVKLLLEKMPMSDA